MTALSDRPLSWASSGQTVSGSSEQWTVLRRGLLRQSRSCVRRARSATGAMLSVADQLGIGLAKAARRALKKSGFDLVYDRSYPVDLQDMSAIMTEVKQLDPIRSWPSAIRPTRLPSLSERGHWPSIPRFFIPPSDRVPTLQTPVAPSGSVSPERPGGVGRRCLSPPIGHFDGIRNRMGWHKIGIGRFMRMGAILAADAATALLRFGSRSVSAGWSIGEVFADERGSLLPLRRRAAAAYRRQGDFAARSHPRRPGAGGAIAAGIELLH